MARWRRSGKPEPQARVAYSQIQSYVKMSAQAAMKNRTLFIR